MLQQVKHIQQQTGHFLHIMVICYKLKLSILILISINQSINQSISIDFYSGLSSKNYSKVHWRSTVKNPGYIREMISKKMVWSRCWNVDDSADVTSEGRSFHVRAATTGKARLTTVDSLTDGTTRRLYFSLSALRLNNIFLNCTTIVYFWVSEIETAS